MFGVRCLFVLAMLQPVLLGRAADQMEHGVRRKASSAARETTSNEIGGNDKFPRGKIPDAKLSWKLFLDNNKEDKGHARGYDASHRINTFSRQNITDAEKEGEKQPTPRSPTTFAAALRDNAVVAKKSFAELRPFHRPTRANGLLPSSEFFNEDLGRFTATALGAYQLNAQLHISPASNRSDAGGRNYARGLLCINSQCQQNAALEFVQPIAKDARLFTLSVSGVLYLRPGEYVSAYVDNPSTRSITVLAGSLMTGVLLGS